MDLLGRLRAHHAEGYLSLHMPGHKEAVGLAPYLAALGAELDITELPGFDDLHDARGILRESMDRAARLWHSRRSLFQVNGSTGALLAAIRAATRRGDTIVMARHCHKAIYHAVELCGLEPVYLRPPVEERFGVTGSVTPELVAAALAEHPEARLVVYPSPTYDGVLSDTAGICAVAHEHGAAVLVDEAHGAHLGLAPEFPGNAMQAGADLAAASLHKLLPSLTQTAILHVGSHGPQLSEVERQAGIFQSSSPSYLLMASMDGCVRLLEERGAPLFAAWAARLRDFDERTRGLRHLRLLGHGAEAGRYGDGVWGLDPSKILISTRASALTGVELKELLRRDHKIELEMAMDHYAVAMTGLGTGDDMPQRLADALLALDAQYGPAPGGERPIHTVGQLPPRRCSIEEAAMGRSGMGALADARGRISAEYLWAYPPGIPLVTPGEEITADLVRTVERLHRAGVHLIGTCGRPPHTVATLCADRAIGATRKTSCGIE